MQVERFGKGDTWTTEDGRIRIARAMFWAVVDDSGCVLKEGPLTASVTTKREAEAILRRLQEGSSPRMEDCFEGEMTAAPK